MEPVKIEELAEEKRIAEVRKATCSLLKLTETMKSLVDEVERLKGIVETEEMRAAGKD